MSTRQGCPQLSSAERQHPHQSHQAAQAVGCLGVPLWSLQPPQPPLRPDPSLSCLSSTSHPGVPTHCLTGLVTSLLALITILYTAARATFENWKSHHVTLLLKILQWPPVVLRIVDEDLQHPAPAPWPLSPSLDTPQPHRPSFMFSDRVSKPCPASHIQPTACLCK